MSGRFGCPRCPALWLATSLVATGCADARGRFEEFEDRRGSEASAGGAEAEGGAPSDCRPPPPDRVAGRALLALESTTAPGKPVLFIGELNTPELDGGTGVVYRYRALDAGDRRTELGTELVVGPFRLADDGEFRAEAPRAELPGAANAIAPGLPLDTEITLFGRICGVQEFYCGEARGTVFHPIRGALEGQFGLSLLPESGVPVRPRYGCAEDALAEPLP